MAEEEIVVLVLGVGGNVSQGILKALTLSTVSCKVIGACISPLAFGLYTVDQAYVSPRADDPDFFDWLINTCRAEGVQVILSGVEPVLTFLANHSEMIYEHANAVCIVSSSEQLLIGDDKYLTCKWLEENNFNYPRYAIAEDERGLKNLVKVCGYPLIAKPRRGKGSHGLLELHNETDLINFNGRKDYIVQEYLGDASSEYTAGCFSDSDGNVRGVIVLKRELLDGTTYRAEVGEFPKLRAEAKRIAETLRPMGPCNIQMRLSNGYPVCFEINVRFSGTTPMRARFGFNDVESTLRHYILGEPARDLPYITEGIAARYWNELYVDMKANSVLRKTNYLKNPKGFSSQIEDYGLLP